MLCVALPLVGMTAACGGGGGGVNSTPAPVAPPAPPAPPPPPPPPPTPGSQFDTFEYRRSSSVAQAQAIAAYEAGATGSGIIAGVIDSGINSSSAEFAGRIHPNSQDLVSGRSINDDGGHGTAVSSVLLGAKNEDGTHGVAFNATLLTLRTDTPGSCTDPNPDKGCSHDDNNLAKAVDLARTTGAKVINMSLGGSPANANLRAAIDRATAAGIIIVISAGNDRDTNPTLGENPDSLAQVANTSVARGLVIIAGAVDSSSALAPFSNKAGNGAAHYITALGVRVRSIDEAGNTFLYSGTSFAAPTVAGAVALLAQAFPTLTPTQIVDLLFRSATDLGAAGNDTTFGFGELNITNAFRPQGSASLAGSAVPVSLTSNGSLSAAMGDAPKTGAQTVILDGYGRAFNVDLGGAFAPSRLTSKLASSLSFGTRNLAAFGEATGIALSIAPGNQTATLNPLLLSPDDKQQARALAASVVTRLGRDTQLAFGIARSSEVLSSQLAVRRAANFLAAEAARDGWGFDPRAKSAFALRQTLVGFGLTATAETGDARVWRTAEELATIRSGYRRYGYAMTGLSLDRDIGPITLVTKLTHLNEQETVLGARFGTLVGNGGAQSWFADAQAFFEPARNWRLTGAYRKGWTRANISGVRSGADHLKTSAWSFDVTRAQLFSSNDHLSLRIAQPLRVSKGGFDLTLPDGYDYLTGVTGYRQTRLNLAPEGREIDAELAYGLPLLGGAFDANLYWRKDPGNIAAAPDDVGAALRFTYGF
jgi:Subtilase family